MSIFTYSFTVNAPLEAVGRFHSRTDILRRLTPPPIFVRIHRFGAMEEGMMAEFTMWFGPVPVRWRAEHINVGPHGFTDVQWEGPMETWKHTHRFLAESPTVTRIFEHIDYTYKPGWRGWLARLVFNKPGLYALFTYRKLITRWSLRRSAVGAA